MEVSRRDFQALQERVGNLESNIHAIEQRLAKLDDLLSPENLVCRVGQGGQRGLNPPSGQRIETIKTDLDTRQVF
jgi:hypothetical protein